MDAFVMFWIVVIFISIFAWSPPSCSAVPSAILEPHMIQSVCPGERVSYNCTARGSIMDVYCPPLVNVSRPLRLLAGDPVGTFYVESNSASTILVELVQSTGGSSFMGTVSLHFSDEQIEGPVDVQCRVSTADEVNDTDSVTFFVSGKPNPTPTTTYTYSQVQNECEEGTAIPVNMFWNFPENTSGFIIKLKSMNYNTAVGSVDNNITVLLPRGMYSVTLCTRNRCGELCQDHPDMEIDCTSQPETKSAAADVGLIIVAALFIVTAIITVVVAAVTVLYSIKIRKKKRKKNNEITVSTKDDSELADRQHKQKNEDTVSTKAELGDQQVI